MSLEGLRSNKWWTLLNKSDSSIEGKEPGPNPEFYPHGLTKRLSVDPPESPQNTPEVSIPKEPLVVDNKSLPKEEIPLMVDNKSHITVPASASKAPVDKKELPKKKQFASPKKKLGILAMARRQKTKLSNKRKEESNAAD
jgi:hypothetical protein